MLKKERWDDYLIHDREPLQFNVVDGHLSFQRDIYCFFWWPRLSEVEEAKSLGREFNQSLDLWRDLNPPVFDNAITILDYTSFFRYVRSTNPDAWKTFVQETSKVKIERMETPVLYTSPLRQFWARRAP